MRMVCHHRQAASTLQNKRVNQQQSSNNVRFDSLVSKGGISLYHTTVQYVNINSTAFIPIIYKAISSSTLTLAAIISLITVQARPIHITARYTSTYSFVKGQRYNKGAG
jgi:hypothetical protein